MVRLSIEMNVAGSTLDEIMTNAVTEWNRLSQSSGSALPAGSEIDVTPVEASVNHRSYTARVFIRTKVEDNV